MYWLVAIPDAQQVTAFLGEDFDLDVYVLDELGRFTAVVLTLSDANVSKQFYEYGYNFV